MSESHTPDASTLRAAFELAPIGVAVADMDGRIEWPNPSFCEMLGLTRDQVVGRRIHELTHPEERLGEQMKIAELVSGQVDSYQLRKRFLHASGTVVQVLQTSHRVSVGNDFRLVNHIADITEQVHREAESSTHERMRTVGRLANAIAHDFNNLLTAIQTNAALLTQVVSDDEAMDMIDDVMMAAEAGARLTDRLLGYSRGHTGSPEKLDLGALVRERLPVLRSVSPGVEMEVVVQDQAWVFADAQQVEQVLLNLVSNARLATKITIRVQQRWAEVHLDVEDNGGGMTEAVRLRAFEPYFTTRKGRGGTGLGLTTVYAAVTSHGAPQRSTRSSGTARSSRCDFQPWNRRRMTVAT